MVGLSYVEVKISGRFWSGFAGVRRLGVMVH